jgi:hypothetical protein
MRNCLVLILIFVLVSVYIYCFTSTKLNVEEVKSDPKWFNVYNEQTIGDIYHPTENTFETTLNKNKCNIKIFSELKIDQSFNLIGKINNKTQRLQQSKYGFENARWSIDRKYFTVVKITACTDVTDGDIFIYQLVNNQIKLIYSEAAIGFNQGGFSNDNRRFAYWANGKGLTIVNLATGKKYVHKIPVDEVISGTGFIGWRKDDKAIFINCYIGNSYKNYVISNF